MLHVNSPARVSSGRSFMAGGRWAAERLLKAMKEGRPMGPKELRTADALPFNSWIEFDKVAIREGLIRSPTVTELLAAGLRIPIPNAMGKTIFQYDLVSDLDPAVISLDGLARSDYDTLQFDNAQVPLPITHKDFNIGLRRLEASRNSGTPLDTTQSEVSGKRVGEAIENMTLNGGPTFGGLPIYGLRTHPKRLTGGFGTNGNWAQVAKTGANIYADVSGMAKGLRAQRMFGPYWLEIPGGYMEVLDNDYAPGTNNTITIKERLMKIEGLTKIIVSDQLPADNVLLYQATREVIAIADGESIQTIQWDIYGGMAIAMKVFAIQVPVVRATDAGRSGIYHMS